MTDQGMRFTLGSRSDLHVSIVISRDDATSLPTVYLRDTVAFETVEEAEAYERRLQAWLLRRPLPDPLAAPAGFPRRRWHPRQLEQWLDRLDEWAPPPDSGGVFDREEVERRL